MKIEAPSEIVSAHVRQRGDSTEIPNEDIDKLLKEMDTGSVDELDTEVEDLTQNEGVTKQSFQGNDVGEEETIEITEDLQEVEITQRDRLAIEKLNKLNGNETPSRDRSNSVGAKLGLKKVGSGAITEQSQHQSLKQENDTPTVANRPKFKVG